MKATELRIGNWVQCENRIVQYVYRIWQGGAELAEDKNGGEDSDYSDDEIFGIQLTEKWLRIFGFEGNNNNEGFHKGIIELKYITTDEHFEFEYQTPAMKWMLVQIKFVHQLQNLYFSLTSEELTLQS